jgi:hypothetical protein
MSIYYDDSIMSSSFGDHENPQKCYLLCKVPRAILQDVIFREMLELKDIARLEVAAAIHRLHDEDQVS